MSNRLQQVAKEEFKKGEDSVRARIVKHIKEVRDGLGGGPEVKILNQLLEELGETP